MRLKELREQKGVKQQDVAEMIGYSVVTYARYEKGQREPDYQTLKKLANYFGVSVDYLIGHDEK